jgi:transcriptional regulator with XRE-family HTH domain
VADARRHSPNRQLAWERLQRGWSYEELAERVRTEMSRSEETDSGLTANTVRRWETGERWPEPRYRKHLVTLFDRPASDLGLLTPDELTLRPAIDVVHEIRRLLAMLDAEARLAGMDRGTFLRCVLGIGALPVLGRLLDPDEERWNHLTDTAVERRTVDAKDVAAYAEIAEGQRALYWTGPATQLFESSSAHTHLGVRLLRDAGRDQREPLGAVVAESALLTARLSFFDLRKPDVAQRAFQVALEATREAGDHALAAVVLGHMAFVPAFSGRPAEATSLLDAALQHCWHGVSPWVRAWLYCVAAEAQARSAGPAAYQRHIDLAQAAIAGDPGDQPAWMDFFDASRLRGFAGYAALAAGAHQDAAEHLQVALDRLAPSAAKQRSVLLADLATAHRDEPEQATAYLDRAIDVLDQDWYGMGFDRVRAVARELPAGSARHIGDRLLEVVPAS